MQQKIALIGAVVRPSSSLRERLFKRLGRKAHGVDLAQFMDDNFAVETFAELLKKRIEARVTTDGRVDYRDVAADIIAEMKRSV